MLSSSLFLRAYRRLASLPKITLDCHQESQIRARKLLRRFTRALFFQSLKRRLYPMCRLHVIGGGVGIGCVVVIRIELAARDVLLERRHRNRTRELFTPTPDGIQSTAQDGRKCIDVLVPGSVEVTEEQQIVVLQFLLRLLLGGMGKLTAFNDDPSGKMNERKLHQIFLQRFN